MRNTTYDLDSEFMKEERRKWALARQQGWPYDPSIVQRDAGEKWWLPSSAEAGTVPPMPPITPIVPPPIVPAEKLQTQKTYIPLPSTSAIARPPGGLGQPPRPLTQYELETQADQNQEAVEARSRTLQNPNFRIQRGIGSKQVQSASELGKPPSTRQEISVPGYDLIADDPNKQIPPLRTPGLGERLQGLSGGVTGAVGRFFDDPRRVALVQAGLTAMDPGSYYDKEGFYSTFGGLNRALGAGVKTYKELSKPTELSFSEQQKIKHGYDIKLEKEKAKGKARTTKLDANKRLRYVDTGELVYKNITVEPEAIKKMDENQIFGAERKLSREFVDATKVPRGQIDAYRRIESIFDDPMSPDPPGRNSMISDAGWNGKVPSNGSVSLIGFKTADGKFFELDQGGAADLALIFNFMKMLDPQSVVRESEFALAGQTGGMEESIKAGWQKLMEGGRLSTQMRRNLMRQSRVQFNSADEEMERQLREYTKLAKRYESMGVQSERVYAWDRYEPTLPFQVFGKPTAEELDAERIKNKKLEKNLEQRLKDKYGDRNN